MHSPVTSGKGKTIGGIRPLPLANKAPPHSLRSPRLFPPLEVPSCLGFPPHPVIDHSPLAPRLRTPHCPQSSSAWPWRPEPLSRQAKKHLAILSPFLPSPNFSHKWAQPFAGALNCPDFSNCTTVELENIVCLRPAPLACRTHSEAFFK